MPQVQRESELDLPYVLHVKMTKDTSISIMYMYESKYEVYLFKLYKKDPVMIFQRLL